MIDKISNDLIKNGYTKINNVVSPKTISKAKKIHND